MNPFDRQRAIMALVLLASALFVAAGMPYAARWRRRLRAAAIIGFLIALAAAPRSASGSPGCGFDATPDRPTTGLEIPIRFGCDRKLLQLFLPGPLDGRNRPL
jgi:hypothetical protein